jgi:hypothetical protein
MLRQYATSRMVAGSKLYEFIVYFQIIYPSQPHYALGSTQPLTEMSSEDLPCGGKGRPARNTDNLTIMSEPIV